ncbi:hypothetical protein FO519_007857 [Halicephalobus sp. NKZ332]|nr:hypothetical protein FO519_007857 [Halicephalobus sp. NKZ332]
MDPTTPPNPFYEAYKSGMMWGVFPAITIMMIILAFGYFGNINIVCATITNKNLKGSCNWLIAFASIADSVHVTAHIFFAYTIYSGRNFVNLDLCLHVMTISLVGLCTGNVFILLIGVDRLISVLFPIRQRQMNKPMYLGFCVFISLIFPAYIIYLSYVNASINPNTKVVCLIVEAMHGSPNDIYSTISLVIMAATIVCYGTVWILLRFKLNNSTSFKSMFKSLTIIMMTVFFSWLLVALMMLVTGRLGASMEVGFYVPLYSGITVNISCASNFYILYYFSIDYRVAFQRQLSFILGKKFDKIEIIRTNSSVVPSKVPVKNELARVI